MRKSSGEVLEHARPEADRAALLPHRECADAVVLLFEDPFGALDDVGGERRKHRPRGHGAGGAKRAHAVRALIGSPVAARETSPPASRAMPARSRRVSAERGFVAVSTVVEATRSLILIRSLCSSPVCSTVLTL